jgi:spore germination protein GerM
VTWAPSSRWSRALLLLLAVLLPSCGVQSQQRSEPVPTAELPTSEERRAPTAGASPAAVTVYFTDEAGGADRRLVELQRRAEAATPDAAVRVLLQGSDRYGAATAIPPATRVRSVQVRDGTMRIDVSEDFLRVRGTDQLLAVAQVVWTVTEFPAVDAVLLQVSGRPLPLPVDGGEVTNGPVRREQYAAFAPRD